MYLNGRDAYGRESFLTSAKLKEILGKIDDFLFGKKYFIREIRQDDTNSALQRYDIEVIIEEQDGKLWWQKLLLLNGEVVDGKTFHRRYKEWYGNGAS